MVELADSGQFGDPSNKWTRTTAKCKFKKAEQAKFDKYGRNIVDIGVGGSLVTAFLAEAMKLALCSQDFLYCGGLIRIVKNSDPFILHDAFNLLITCPLRFVYIAYSDDAACSIWIRGVLHRYNADIKSCDVSHTDELFDLLHKCVPTSGSTAIKIATDQLRMPLKIVDCNDPKNFVTVRPKARTMYSGSGLTTVGNGYGSLLIGMAIGEYDITCSHDLELAARDAGYIMTGFDNPLSTIEGLQFLKHSPIMDKSGVYRPMLNLGVFFRASGQVWGDLPGRGPLLQRALAFQRGLLRGAYPKSTCAVISAMWRQLGDGEAYTLASKLFKYKVVNSSAYPYVEFSDDSLLRRYNMPSYEYDDLIDIVQNGYGYTWNCPALERILTTDYDVGLTHSPLSDSYFYTPGRGVR